MFGMINFGELIFADIDGLSGGTLPPFVPPTAPDEWDDVEPNPVCNWDKITTC